MLDTFMSQLFEAEIGLNDALLETSKNFQGPARDSNEFAMNAMN